MASNKVDYDFAIVGAGISGLTASVTILNENPLASILLIERSERVGGRILNTQEPLDSDQELKGVDLGGAWLWPSSMPFTMQLVHRYNIKLVQQEGADGTQMRVQGGVTVMIQKLLTELGHGSIKSDKPLTDNKNNSSRIGKKVTLKLNSVLVKVEERTDESYVGLTYNDIITKDSSQTPNLADILVKVRHLVISAPPAKIMEDVQFVGSESRYITNSLKKQMQKQPIWMASAGKLALSYTEKFWDSKSIMLSLRPVRLETSDSSAVNIAGAFQVYDAGLNDKREHTIVAFVTCGKGKENPYDAQAMAKIVAQQLDNHLPSLTRSNSFLSYRSVYLKCWKTDKNINKVNDAEPFPIHPQPIFGLNEDAVEGRRVWFGGSEASEDWTGMIEGAVMNGTEVAKKIANRS